MFYHYLPYHRPQEYRQEVRPGHHHYLGLRHPLFLGNQEWHYSHFLDYHLPQAYHPEGHPDHHHFQSLRHRP